MAASSSNPSFIVEIGEEYPSPSHVYTPTLVTVKLSGKDRYIAWKTQIWCLLTSHNMLGFINGKVVRPKGNMHREEAWIRSDSIVKGWILGTLSEEVTMDVLKRLTLKNRDVDFTAKDVWDELERIYGPDILQQAIDSSYSSVVTEIREGYPYPSHVRAPDHVTVKLSGENGYNAWKTQMTQLLVSHDMLGFINGKFVRPTENSTRKVGGSLEAWTRSDELVISWILGSVSYEATINVFESLMCEMPNADFTAKDVWDELECIYGQQGITETELITEEDAISEDKSEEEEEEMACPSRFEWKYRGLMNKTEAEKKLYECIVKQEMDLVNDVMKRGGVTVTDKITENGDTALHVAVGTSKGLEFFKKLLKKTPKRNISLADLKNSNGSTLLHIAATVGNIDAAEILMDEYPDMLYKTDNEGQTPLVVALSNMHSKVYWDLLELIEKNRSIHKNTLFTDKLLELAISYKDFYMARNMIWWWCTKLDSDVVLMAIAQNYPCELSFWERRVAELPFVKRRLQKHHKAFHKLKSVKRIEKRHEAFQVLKSVCEKIKESSDHKRYYTKPVLEATRLNALEVVKVLVYHFPDAFWSASEDGHNVIQYAVINRSEKIYNLLYHMSEHRNVYKTIKDASRNNLLHLAARLAPSEKLNSISGAALQIQYELQWYKEVEDFVCSLNITQKNSFEETPRMIFTRTHKELVTEGEKWMKSTAESYTITAALITTIVFAAAITVPGGNTQETGVPIFTNNPAFTIFAVSDAISLFTAVMSLLMFLSILTARFAEEDFLIKLPRKLITGLVILFISTTTMIIAFGAALFIVFGQNNGSLLIPIGVFTSLTITFFVALQFPLVVDLMRTTYGRSIFGKRNATTKTCLQNYIRKMIGQPIVEDKKEERERALTVKKKERDIMEIDGCIDPGYYSVHSTDDIPFNI